MLSVNLSESKYKTHSEYITKIIQGLFSSNISEYIAFKWWTLAYLCYDLDRYSTDIDLDLLNHDAEKDVMDKITSLLSNIWEIKNMTKGRDLHRWIFRYDDKSTNIKVELNKRDLSWNTYEYRQIFWQNIYCMDKETMTTNKLIALWDRRYNRDLFDTYFFRKQWFEYKEEIINKRTWYSLVDYINYLIKELPNHYRINTILADGMWDVLTDQQKIWVKEHLLEETIKVLQEYVNNK